MKTKLLIVMLLSVTCMSNLYSQTQFWGTTWRGGATNQGTIFTADANGTNFQVRYSFVNATGAMPLGGVTMAYNQKLYGVTELGGYGDSCVVYCYDPATGIYDDIHDLYQNMQQGYNAQSPMMSATSGQLFGLTTAGGTLGNGVIYRIDPAINSYTDVHNFDGINGRNPMGSLMQVNNGKLYGTTANGGANNFGTIFSFDPATLVYSKLYDFNAITGRSPQYGALMQATDLKLYGLADFGGANSYGVLFSFDPATNVYTDLYDFDQATGAYPEGTLIQATNGLIYGTTYNGGAHNKGVIFSYDITSGTYTDLHNFAGLDGRNPSRGVTESNGKLYGTTNNGGANGGTYNGGVAFKYNIATNHFYKVADFNNGTLGSGPDCNMVETPILTPTGIAETMAPGEAAVYPNPATNSLTVRSTGKEEVVEFTDPAGKELLTVTLPANKNISDMDISHFPNMFFIKRQNGEVTKIVRQ